MKKFLLLLLAVTAIGCSDNDSATTTNAMAGTWILQYHENSEGVKTYPKECGDETTQGGEEQLRLEFYQNGNFEIYFVCPSDGTPGSWGTYTFQNSILTMDYNDGTNPYSKTVVDLGNNMVRLVNSDGGNSTVLKKQ